MTRRDFLRTSAAAGLAVGALPLAAGCGAGSAAGPTTLFTNGTIYVDAATSVRNLLVRDGTVLGTEVDPADWPEPKTGRDVVVGLEEIARTHPGAKALLGFGLNPLDYDAWSLDDLAAIDAFAPDRVALVFDRLGHNCVVNTFAMQKYRIAEKPVPYGGTVVKQDGRPTGMFREAAMSLVATDALAEFDDASVKAGTAFLAARWAKRGYTALVDLMGGTGLRLMRPHVFRELEQEGKLPLRVFYCYTVLGLADMEEAARYLGQDTDRVRFVGGKLFVDGAFAGGQAWTSWPHLSPAGSHGVPQITTDDAHGPELNVNRIVARAEQLGLNMHYHTQGDLAIKAVLDALDRVLDATGALKGVHTLIHLAYPTDALIDHIHAVNARAGGLHVVTTTQPGFWNVEGDTVQYYGDRALDAYPLKKLVDSGLSVGISTDYSVSPDEYTPPTRIMQVAATGGQYADHHPAVAVQDVVHGLTVGSARTTGWRDVGMLRVGYKADMVVYEKDLYLVPPQELTQTYPAVRSTWVGGVKVG